MKIIIPMAGRGSRLRPHTLTVPKPLLPIAGKPIVQRIVEDLAASLPEKVEEIAFVIGDFGSAVEKELMAIAEALGAKGSVYYQDQPLGTAHAIQCARPSLQGPCLVAFADTLFQADFDFDLNDDGIIWVKKVEDPSAFGVVKTDVNRVITEFVEKSPVFVSDLAIVGIYYFNDGAYLAEEIQYLLDNNLKDRGEFQITDVLENMRQKGKKIKAATIQEWLDCGNKGNVIPTHQRILEIKQDQETLLSPDAEITDSIIHPPCYIGPGAKIKNSIIGPYVSVGSNTIIQDSVIRNTLIQNDSHLAEAQIKDSMIGNQVDYQGRMVDISLGDYTTFIS